MRTRSPYPSYVLSFVPCLGSGPLVLRISSFANTVVRSKLICSRKAGSTSTGVSDLRRRLAPQLEGGQVLYKG